MVSRAAASCNTKQANVEKRSAQSNSVPKAAPDFAAVVIVPGPINAAETTDQNKIFKIRFFVDMEFY
jgi:hypothetical protein